MASNTPISLTMLGLHFVHEVTGVLAMLVAFLQRWSAVLALDDSELCTDC